MSTEDLWYEAQERHRDLRGFVSQHVGPGRLRADVAARIKELQALLYDVLDRWMDAEQEVQE